MHFSQPWLCWQCTLTLESRLNSFLHEQFQARNRAWYYQLLPGVKQAQGKPVSFVDDCVEIALTTHSTEANSSGANTEER